VNQHRQRGRRAAATAATARLLGLVVCALVALTCLAAAGASAAAYVPGKVVVGYPHGTSATVALPRGESVAAAVKRLRNAPGVTYAVPDYLAHASGSWIPDDRGTAGQAAGWEKLQWNFLPVMGVDAPGAWANLQQVGHPGGKGVIIAVLDTGVAYRNWRQYRISPDFTGTKFVSPYDFIAHNAYPLDREGHGTFVTGTLAEATNNGYALTGLAYGASIMPVRVLAADGTGDSATIAKGIRYAVAHGAQVINLSLEFSLDVTAQDIPDILSAIRYAHRKGAFVVAASGNEGIDQIAYPARASGAVSVGATTEDRCVADYSNGGPALDLVAPGGGDDSTLPQDPNCDPSKSLPNIRQLTMLSPSTPGRFGYPGDVFGTSMATPHVAAAAALVIASGVIGRHPTPDAILTRLEQTAQHLGPTTPTTPTTPNADYGWGLIDAAAATAPPAAAARKR